MKKMLFSKNQAFLYSKNGNQPRKSKAIFKFSALKLAKSCLVAQHYFKKFFVDQCYCDNIGLWCWYMKG